MGRKTIAVAPTLPASAKLSRFHGDATDAPLYTIVTWTSRHARGGDAKSDPTAAVVRKRQLALETASHKLLELQRIGASGDKNRSWFVGNIVHQDGSLVVLTPMDPLFVLLHAVVDQKERFLSTYDLLARDQNVWWLQLGETLSQKKIEQICDVQYTGDDAIDNLYVRANETKILAWLDTKVQRVARVLAKTAASNAASGAFDAKFALPGQASRTHDDTAGAAADTEPTAEQIQRFYGEAVDVLADYLPVSIVPALRKHFNITIDTAVSAASSAAAPLDTIRRFDRRAEPEPATTTPSKRGSAATNSATKKKSKLANVDRTGMKSISSFFGKK